MLITVRCQNTSKVIPSEEYLSRSGEEGGREVIIGSPKPALSPKPETLSPKPQNPKP